MVSNELENFGPQQIEPSYELLAAIDDLISSAITTKEMFDRVKKKAKDEGIPDFLVRDLMRQALRRRGLTEDQIQYRLPKKEKSSIQSSVNPENHIEETSTTTESDDINETHDQRSENIINDEVNASMNAASENKIRSELQREIDSLRQQLDDKIGINELLKQEIEESKNQKLEARILDIEELNRNLKVENEQLRHALTKHSFETAAEVKEKQADPEEIKHLTNYIKQLEDINSQRWEKIQQLNQKIESFSRLDHVVDHQPLELDLTDKGGFLGMFFANRGKKVKVIHDGIKIKNILPEVIK
jgi:hypothetical protein